MKRSIRAKLKYTLGTVKQTFIHSVNDSVPACCQGGVGFNSVTHCKILETLKIVTTAAMFGT